MTALLEVTTLPDAVYEAVRERILAQIERPGAVITEQAVAERFGVARPTAKVAIERLVGEGLLRRTAHRSARVPELSREDIADLYANRALLESEAVAALALSGILPPAAVEAQRALTDAALDLGPDSAPLSRADLRFHRALVEAQPSARLARLHSLLLGEIELCTGQVQAHRLLEPADVIAQHQGILDAIGSGAVESARRLGREHVVGAGERLLARYDETRGASTHGPSEERRR